MGLRESGQPGTAFVLAGAENVRGPILPVKTERAGPFRMFVLFPYVCQSRGSGSGYIEGTFERRRSAGAPGHAGATPFQEILIRVPTVTCDDVRYKSGLRGGRPTCALAVLDRELSV